MNTFRCFPRKILTIIMALLLWGAGHSLANAIEIQQVKTPSGITAWLVEDYTVPLISFSMEFKSGNVQDPEGLEGLTSILAAMMDEGAGDLDTAALKAELEDRGIEIGFSSSADDFSGGMRILASEKNRAFELMQMILMQPRFEASSLERIRSAFISAEERGKSNPDTILGNRFRDALFGGHVYGREARGTAESLSKITREDLISHHNNMLAKDNLYIGVVGAISRPELIDLIEATFANLPDEANLKEISDFVPEFGKREHISFPSPQTKVSLALPGMKRENPDFFAAHIMNHILGGGSFSSWLYEEVREKRGLVYGIGTNLTTLDHSAYLAGGFATKPEQAKEALSIMQAEIERMANEGPSADELEAAKKFVYGTYAINNLDTSSKIANVLVGLQSSELGIDYINTRGASIEAVTLDDIKRVAKELLGHSPTIITIGPGDA
ncbi:MAG: pitrilysin family protein [Salaquimonas sp.]